MDEVLLYSGQSVASKILLLDAFWQSKRNKWFENKPSQQNYKLQQILKIHKYLNPRAYLEINFLHYFNSN